MRARHLPSWRLKANIPALSCSFSLAASMYFRCLVYLLLHASAARRHSERFGSTFLSFASRVWDAWNGPPLQGPEGQEVMQLIQALDASDAYCELLLRAGCSSRKCDLCAQRRQQDILDAAAQKILRLSHTQRSRQPLAVFVLGATGAGKTSFINYTLEEELPANHMGFVRSAIHVNADDLRSELVGGYAIYSALVNQKADFPPGLVFDASFLRAEIQKKVLESAVDFLGDSLTVPAFVTQEFLDKNFDVRIFHIEIQGSSDEAKAETARRGIEQRMASGGHFAPPTAEKVLKSRNAALSLKEAGFNVKFFIRSGSQFIPKEDAAGL